MINLLPPEGRSFIQREYWVRVASVYMLVLSAVAASGVALLLPTYFHIAFQINAVTSDIDSVGSEEEFAALENAIKEANAFSRILATSPEAVPATNVINELNDIAGAAISIDGVTIATTDDVMSSIVITGVADTRAGLVAMRDRIEAHALFDKAELPISNLAKDQNIPFSITITPASEPTKTP